MGEIKLPSAHQVGQLVNINFNKFTSLEEVIVSAVRFTDYGKVLYDVKIYVGEDNYTNVVGIDSYFVHPTLSSTSNIKNVS